MNKKRRAGLEQAKLFLNAALFNVQRAGDEESTCFDNLPESLQESDKGYKMEEAISSLEDAASYIEDAITEITTAIS